MAAYLEQYAATFKLPVVMGVRIDGLRHADDGDGYVIRAGDARWQAPQVVLATGPYSAPRVPDFAGQLDPRILQIHSSEYRNPAQLRPGEVLVVGASNSGAEIAFDIAYEHRTWLSGRDPGHLPIENDGRLARVLGPLFWLLQSRVMTVNTPLGRKFRPIYRTRGGPVIRVKPAHPQAAGVERVLAKTPRASPSATTLHPAHIPREVAASSRRSPAIPARRRAESPALAANPRLSPLSPEAP
jgi:putative flavoprotein involved in K+ transport